MSKFLVCYLTNDEINYIENVIYTLHVEGMNKVNFSSVIRESLELLQERNPTIPQYTSLPQRHYKGGLKIKEERLQKMIYSTQELNQWVENYVHYKINNQDSFFTKSDAIRDGLKELNEKYKDKLLIKPKIKNNL